MTASKAMLETELLSAIDAVFSDSSRPAAWPHDEPVSVSGKAGSAIVVTDETIEAARRFSGIDWKTLDASKYESLSNRYAENFLSFHSDEAFKYYLPAYLKMLVVSESARRHLLGPFLHALAPTTDARKAALRAWQQVRLGQFSVPQARVVLNVLKFLADRYGVETGRIDAGGGWNDFSDPIAYWAERVGRG